MQIENRILNKHTLQHEFYFLEVWAWVMVRINAFWMKKVYTDTKLKNIRLNRKVEGLFLSSISIKVHLLLFACHIIWWSIGTVSVSYDIIIILVIKITQKYQSFHEANRIWYKCKKYWFDYMSISYTRSSICVQWFLLVWDYIKCLIFQ